MKKKNNLQLKLHPDFGKESYRKMRPKQKKILDRSVNDMAKHFKEDGWDLNFGFYSMETLQELLGFSLEGAFCHRAFKKIKGLMLITSDKNGDFVLRVPKGAKK